jgi:methylmalonyl-CoA/ethylmalonyl-CoA epimerase
MEKLEHIGIAVKSFLFYSLFEALLNTGCYKEEFVGSESVKTAFFAVGTQKIELLEEVLNRKAPSQNSLKKEKASTILPFWLMILKVR